MSRLKSTFQHLRNQKRPAFIAYICSGDPDLETTEKLVYEMDKAGVDIIELGIPFSDPIADGPTIQRAAQRALKHATRLIDVIQLVKKIRRKSDIPIVFMCYYNLIYKIGIKKFAELSRKAEIDGVIVPDLPPDEADELIEQLRPLDIDTIFLLAPTSTDSRIRLVTNKSTGFVYYVSLTGVTGAREKLGVGVKSALAKIRRFTDTPICVGFGISTKEQVKQMANWGAEGIIVGSAIVSRIEQNLNKPNLLDEIGGFITDLISGIPTRNNSLR